MGRCWSMQMDFWNGLHTHDLLPLHRNRSKKLLQKFHWYFQFKRPYITVYLSAGFDFQSRSNFWKVNLTLVKHFLMLSHYVTMWQHGKNVIIVMIILSPLWIILKLVCSVSKLALEASLMGSTHKWSPYKASLEA